MHGDGDGGPGAAPGGGTARAAAGCGNGGPARPDAGADRDAGAGSGRDAGVRADGDAGGGTDGDAGSGADDAGSGGVTDIVTGVLRQWRRVHPELDTAPMALIGRLNRCAALLQQAVDAPLRQEGLSRPEFDILGTLRRVDEELTPGRLVRETFASGAAVTKRLKELEARGLVARRADERDRRVAHLSLTEAGRELVDRVLPEQLAYEGALLAGLSAERREQLSGGLGELLLLLEAHTSPA